jgi:hypothetical protein
MKLFKDGPVDINREIDDYRATMLFAAMREAKGSKTEAARLLCLDNYQTVSNWLAKYKMEGLEWT